MELNAENISFKYNSNHNLILDNINLSISSNEVKGLIGSSGSGKSTLCKILAGFSYNYEGNIYLDNKKISKKGFNPIQLVFQHPEKTMNPKWKMGDILNESWDVNDDLLEEFGIQKSWLNRWPNELSGGELQRFSVLRALNPKTKFIIADEMTTMLDAVTQVQIWNSVLKIAEQQDIGVLVVSHDKQLLNKVCGDILSLENLNNL